MDPSLTSPAISVHAGETLARVRAEHPVAGRPVAPTNLLSFLRVKDPELETLVDQTWFMQE